MLSVVFVAIKKEMLKQCIEFNDNESKIMYLNSDAQTYRTIMIVNILIIIKYKIFYQF